MRLCIPVTEDKGLESPVAAHFGSAPLFLIVDTDGGTCRALPDADVRDEDGTWHPLLSLAGEQFDGVAVDDIGAGALAKLQAKGVRVFVSSPTTVGQTLAALKAGRLREAAPAADVGPHGPAPRGTVQREHGPHGHGRQGHGPHGHGPQGHGHAGPRGNRGGRG